MDVLSRPLSKREKFLVLFLALLLVASAYYFLVHEPVTQQMNEAQADIDFYSVENEIMQAKLAKKNQMLEEMDEILSDPDVQEIPEFDNQSILMSFLNSVLSQTVSYDISCGDVALDSETGIYRRPIYINCNIKSYKQAEKLLEEIRTCPYCSQVGGVSFSPYAYDEYSGVIGDGGINLSVSMTFYEKNN